MATVLYHNYAMIMYSSMDKALINHMYSENVDEEQENSRNSAAVCDPLLPHVPFGWCCFTGNKIGQVEYERFLAHQAWKC